jgi:uncharacterized protein (DUF697 family)
MPAINHAKSFWKNIKAVSITEIAREAQRPFTLSVVGEPAAREAVLDALFDGHAAPEGYTMDRGAVPVYLSTQPEDGFPANATANHLVVQTGGRGEARTEALLFNVEELGGWERAKSRILEQRPDLALALARRFPAFRRQVAEGIIRDTATTNAEFAMLNALPGVVPIVAPLLPAAAIGDVFMLTKNQAMMLFRLAAAHGLPVDVRARSKEMGPLLGNALGWRALARELVGMVPGGIGLGARGAIAYAGTAALGRALLAYYETGRLPDRAQINRFYTESYAGAKRIAEERLRFLRRKPQEPARDASAAPERELEPTGRPEGRTSRED